MLDSTLRRAGQSPPLDKVITLPKVVTLPGGSALCLANTTLLGCQAVVQLPLRTAAAELMGGRVARHKPPQAVGIIDGRSLVAEPRGYGQSGARGESGCRAEASPSTRRFETGFFLAKRTKMLRDRLFFATRGTPTTFSTR